jgi:glutathione S-transferase
MKLYNVDLSNYAAKCRLVIYEKKLPVEITDIPGGDLKSPEYLKIYPLGKTPMLEVDGQVIGESEVINEYLEEKFPNPSLLPGNAEARAYIRRFSRFHDLYVEPPIRALFMQTLAEEKDPALVAEALDSGGTQLDHLERMLSGKQYAAGEDFTLADCALIPTIYFATFLLPMSDAPSPLDGRPKLDAWWQAVQERESVKKVLAEMQKTVMCYARTGG